MAQTKLWEDMLRGVLGGLLLWALGICLAFLLCSCQTVQAVEKVPTGCWTDLWLVVEALFLDVWDVVELLL